MKRNLRMGLFGISLKAYSKQTRNSQNPPGEKQLSGNTVILNAFSVAIIGFVK